MVSITYACIGGRQVTWQTLIEAAVQDTVGTERLASGHLAYPNGEHELAEAYRRLLAQQLPAISERELEAYLAYCQSTASTRTADPVHRIGHGSWVSGPDGGRQATWQAWQRLQERVAAAAAGRYVPAEPCGV